MYNPTYFSLFKKLLSASAFVGALTVILPANAADDDIFAGWNKAGVDLEQYQTGFLEKTQDDANQLAFIKSLKPNRRGNSTLMRTTDVSDYRGKRVQLTTMIKTKEVKSVGAWLQVNGMGRGRHNILDSDNMAKRRIKGTTDWQAVSIVLDIDENAESISYGVMLEGKGNVWFALPTITVVDDTVPTTVPKNNRLIRVQDTRLRVYKPGPYKVDSSSQ